MQLPRAVLSFAALLLFFTGPNAMADTLDFKWEGVADRPIATKLLVKVDTIKKTSTGLFGLGNSPSVAGYQPDPHTVRGEVVSGPGGMAGRKFTLEMPGYKAKALTAGAQAGFGLVAERSKGHDIVVCVAPAPDGAAATQWLADWHCPTD